MDNGIAMLNNFIDSDVDSAREAVAPNDVKGITLRESKRTCSNSALNENRGGHSVYWITGCVVGKGVCR